MIAAGVSVRSSALSLGHCRLACPEAKLPALLNESRTRFRSFEPDKSVVATLADPCLCKQRRCRLDVPDELHVSEGVGDKITCGRVLDEHLDAVLRWQQRHRIIENRWTATELLIGLDPRSTTVLHAAYPGGDDFQHCSFRFHGGFERCEDGAIHPIRHEHAELSTLETLRTVQQDAERRGFLQILPRRPRGIRRIGE